MIICFAFSKFGSVITTLIISNRVRGRLDCSHQCYIINDTPAALCVQGRIWRGGGALGAEAPPPNFFHEHSRKLVEAVI